tara:strand:- start:10303 stop:10623 length:321 start_codon:yes stop_codon:yes gene_type:complete
MFVGSCISLLNYYFSNFELELFVFLAVYYSFNFIIGYCYLYYIINYRFGHPRILPKCNCRKSRTLPIIEPIPSENFVFLNDLSDTHREQIAIMIAPQSVPITVNFD